MTSGSILIVDDDRAGSEVLAELLAFEGYSALTAKNGAEALDRMKAVDHVSLVLLDLWMPSMNGFEFLQQKRADNAINDIPVVVLSAIAPASVDGAEAVLTKPVNVEQLLNTIKRFSE